MRRLFVFAAAFAAGMVVPAQAQVVTVTETVEEWVEVGADRLAPAHRAAVVDGPAYGPFRVLDAHRAALVDATDTRSPAAFRAMLRDHPQIRTIEMIECPGTDDDVANLQLGRMIRSAGITTHVPRGGSVRSGAVELFLAGAHRTISDGAEFAVHAWRDSEGREADDFPVHSPVHRTYLDYYREMGVAQPQAFYEMTNAVPFDSARWLSAQDMRAWLGEGQSGQDTVTVPAIAYLDLGTLFP
jgi:hypothetical protein